jgi:uncharacterized protein YraI
MSILTVCANISSVFADAVDYDVQQADFYVYVATPDGGLNMRYGPGAEYDKVTENRIPDGVRLYITLTSGHWGYTSYNGNRGWVTLKQTSSTPPSTPKPTPIPTPEPTVVPTPVPQQTVATVTPQITATPSAQTEQTEAEETTVANTALRSEFLLVAILVLFIVIIALLIVIIINIKSRK